MVAMCSVCWPMNAAHGAASTPWLWLVVGCQQCRTIWQLDMAPCPMPLYCDSHNSPWCNQNYLLPNDISHLRFQPSKCTCLLFLPSPYQLACRCLWCRCASILFPSSFAPCVIYQPRWRWRLVEHVSLTDRNLADCLCRHWTTQFWNRNMMAHTRMQQPLSYVYTKT